MCVCECCCCSFSLLLLLLFLGLFGFWCCLFRTRDAICRLSGLLSMWRYAHTWLYIQRVTLCIYFVIYSPCDFMFIVLSTHHVTLCVYFVVYSPCEMREGGGLFFFR